MAVTASSLFIPVNSPLFTRVPRSQALSDSMTLGNGQAVLLRELVVPFVMGGHAHDRARAVVHEHVVGGEDRHLLPGEGMDAQRGPCGGPASRRW